MGCLVLKHINPKTKNSSLYKWLNMLNRHVYLLKYTFKKYLKYLFKYFNENVFDSH